MEKSQQNNYSQEEIEELWKNSKNKTEFCKKLGYKNGNHAKRIQDRYFLQDEDLGINIFKYQKQYIIGPKGTKIESLIGKQYGHWKVIDLDTKKTQNDYKNSWWICQCDCENHTISSIPAGNLKRSKSTNCGCQNTKILIEQMIGMKFGRLTVIEINNNKKSRRGKYLKCKCECGNITDVISVDLRQGKVKSCGCLQQEICHNKLQDLTGQVFGYLKVISLDKENTEKYKQGYFYCQCLNCNSKLLKSIRGSHLKAGEILSCGCIKSQYEKQIENILIYNKIQYKKEYTFQDLIGEQRKLRFDFAIFNNDNLAYLIEYQGEQHFRPIKFWGGTDKFEQRKRYDEIKKEYCKNNNINLIILTKPDEINEANLILKECLTND